MTLSLQEATQRYLTYLKDQGKYPRTLYTYGKDLEQLLAFFGPERLLCNILPVHVAQFLKSNELLLLPNGQPRAPRTVEKTVRVLRLFFTWAKDEQHLFEKLPFPKSLQRDP
jgi:site-specific recombinase XerD